MSVLEQLPERARVCIIRLRSLGDCVLTTPALQLLKQTRPDLEVGVAVEDRFATVFEGNPAVAKHRLRQPGRRCGDGSRTLCVNLHGGTRSQWMTALSGARWRAGFSHHSMTLAYNIKIGRAQRILGVNRTVHTAEHLASAFFALGVPCRMFRARSCSPRESPLERQVRRSASVRFDAGKALAGRALLRSGALSAALEHQAGVPGRPRR